MGCIDNLWEILQLYLLSDSDCCIRAVARINNGAGNLLLASQIRFSFVVFGQQWVQKCHAEIQIGSVWALPVKFNIKTDTFVKSVLQKKWANKRLECQSCCFQPRKSILSSSKWKTWLGRFLLADIHFQFFNKIMFYIIQTQIPNIEMLCLLFCF